MLAPLEKYLRGKKIDQINHTCERPFKTATISNNGDCFVCICDAWLPISVGNIESFTDLEDIWNNPTAKEIQQDITDKKFTNCAVTHCGILNHSIPQPTYRINVALDTSCNLACPTCRREMINFTSGPVYEERLRRVTHFLKLLENFNHDMTIILIGNGDPLASTVMRPIVLNWKPKPNQKIILFTNGLLMKKLLPNSVIFQNISEFHISVDAGSKQVYEQVRRPGKYEVLRENLDWLAENRPAGSDVILKFTLSADNVNDVENFTKMCNYYQYHGVISKLDDWGTFDDFDNKDVVGNVNHELHQTAISQLKIANTQKQISITPFFNKLLY
jgi:MoaA/NifB/PqqE/SkfB family radical SAM enzyme